MVRWLAVGLDEALKLTMENIQPLTPQQVVDLSQCVDRVVWEDMYATVDSPSVDASLKDGYAVISSEIAQATQENPVSLKLTGSMAAGSREENDGCAGFGRSYSDRCKNTHWRRCSGIRGICRGCR